jgi:hypothetical protein
MNRLAAIVPRCLPSHCASRRLPRESIRYPPWSSSRYPPRSRSIWTVGRVSDGLRTISLANLIVPPRPLDMFVNTVPGPYVPGGRVDALAFTVSLIATPLVSVVPEVELAVSQEGVLIE